MFVLKKSFHFGACLCQCCQIDFTCLHLHTGLLESSFPPQHLFTCSTHPWPWGESVSLVQKCVQGRLKWNSTITAAAQPENCIAVMRQETPSLSSQSIKHGMLYLLNVSTTKPEASLMFSDEWWTLVITLFSCPVGARAEAEREIPLSGTLSCLMKEANHEGAEEEKKKEVRVMDMDAWGGCCLRGHTGELGIARAVLEAWPSVWKLTWGRKKRSDPNNIHLYMLETILIWAKSPLTLLTYGSSQYLMVYSGILFSGFIFWAVGVERSARRVCTASSMLSSREIRIVPVGL